MKSRDLRRARGEVGWSKQATAHSFTVTWECKARYLPGGTKICTAVHFVNLSGHHQCMFYPLQFWWDSFSFTLSWTSLLANFVSRLFTICSFFISLCIWSLFIHCFYPSFCSVIISTLFLHASHLSCDNICFYCFFISTIT